MRLSSMMVPRVAAAAFGAALVAAAGPVLADEPLQPATDITRTTPNGAFEVTSKVEEGLSFIARATDAPEGAPFIRMWFIQGFHRNIVVAENGASALVLPEGGNLISSGDPREPLLTFHRPSGISTSILLGDVMDPATLAATASHFEWTRGVTSEGGAFVISLPDGGTTRIDAATGGIVASPVGPRPQTDERIVGVDVPGRELAGCLTYDMLRANLSALGPQEPLPVLPAMFAGGCVSGFVDERADRISVFETGVVPTFESVPDGILATMDPIWGLVPIGGSAPEGVRSISVDISTSLSAGSQQAVENEAWVAPKIYDNGDGQYRTVAISGLDAESTRSALSTLTDRWAGDGVDFANVRERNDLSRLADGTHHLSEVPAGDGDMGLLLEKRGTRIRGLQYRWARDGAFCFDVDLSDDGARATGKVADISADGSARLDAKFAYGDLGTLRPLPPAMAQERILQGGLDAKRDDCLARLDRL